jgi:hypothetical protein
MLNHLRADYGDPRMERTSETWSVCDWWIDNAARHTPLHVCLNSPARGQGAHVIIFDPDRLEGRSVIEERLQTQAEADDLLMRINRLATGQRGEDAPQSDAMK